MIRTAILYPMFALALLTVVVLGCIPFARRREVSTGDFRYGESIP